MDLKKVKELLKTKRKLVNMIPIPLRWVMMHKREEFWKYLRYAIDLIQKEGVFIKDSKIFMIALIRY